MTILSPKQLRARNGCDHYDLEAEQLAEKIMEGLTNNQLAFKFDVHPNVAGIVLEIFTKAGWRCCVKRSVEINPTSGTLEDDGFYFDFNHLQG